MQVLGCLICQLYNPKKLRTIEETSSFQLRYQNCVDMFVKDGKNLGFSMKKLVTSLLFQDEFKQFDLQITDREVYL